MLCKFDQRFYQLQNKLEKKFDFFVKQRELGVWGLEFGVCTYT
jgi:hypothetical protein